MSKQLVSERLSVDSVEDAIELFYDRGWTDGHPVVDRKSTRLNSSH